MKTKNDPQICYACAGTMEQEETTFTVDFGAGVVVLRNVPAIVFSQRGMEWINDEIAQEFEKS
jgi:YgiT-type zinc finger domain-containing protein